MVGDRHGEINGRDNRSREALDAAAHRTRRRPVVNAPLTAGSEVKFRLTGRDSASPRPGGSAQGNSMSKFGNLLGFKPTAAAEDAPGDAPKGAPKDAWSAAATPAASPTAAGDKPAADKHDGNVIELDLELFFPVVTQLGEDNETVRNLLIDAEHKISELDTIKRSINRLVDPVSKTLRAFEETKSQTIGLQTQLNNLRAAYNKQMDAFAAAERRAAGLESECTQLRELIAVAQQRIAALEATGAEQSAELATRRIQVVDLQRILAQLTGDLQTSRDERERLTERVAKAEKRVAGLDADLHAARQQLQLAENERAAVNGLLDKAHTNAAELSRKLLDSDNALTAARQRLAQLEAAFSELQSERARLAGALDEATEKVQNERIAQHARYEALQARATLSETLLDDARKALTSRAEEIGEFERRMAEATMARNAAETRLAGAERALLERDDKIKEYEQTGSRLAGHNDALAKAVGTRETALKSAQHKLRAQDELVKLLEHQLRAARQSNELQIEEINAQLQRERLERNMAEGALEAGRRDIARLLRELAAVQYRLPGFANDAAAKSAAAPTPAKSAA